MEEQVYVDLFATKGIEYILVIGFLLALVLFWRLLNRPSEWSGSPVVTRPSSRAASRWFAVLGDRVYHPGHSWAQPSDDGLVTIGIDDFAQKLIGRPTSIDLPPVGAHIAQGEHGSRLEIDGKSIPLLSPVDGEIVARNSAVLDSPDLINRDPYGTGWLMKVRPSRMIANLRSLMPEQIAGPWMETTERMLGRMMSSDLGVVLQDGGVPVTGIARALSADRWDEIAREFLLTQDLNGEADRGGRNDARADQTP